jgi:hypothetical protein
MSYLLEELSKQLNPQMLQGLSRQLGASEAQTTQAVSALIPMLIGGLSQNVSKGGADSLDQALERDHDGSLLNQLSGMFGGGGAGGLAGMVGGLLGGGQQQGGGNLMGQLTQMIAGGNQRSVNGSGILEHILGGRQNTVSQGVGKATGLNSSQITQLMTFLAPVIMSALGKVKREHHLDAGQVAALVNEERLEIEHETPGAEEGGLLRLLDSNNDGKIDLQDDIAKVGMALGGAFLLSRTRRKSK